MILLPKWVLPPSLPSVYESESATALEMVAKVYGAMNTLIEEYNKFAAKTEKTVSEHNESETNAREEFEFEITKLMTEFTACMEAYLKTNLKETAETLINEAIAAGTLTVAEVYDPESESLNIVTGGEVNG